MICISINQESRRFALADMLNARRLADLLEIRLDRFGKAPDLSELISSKPKPIIMSCRRVQDGGFWDGTEDERLAILRQCIISKADYVEIELDVADQVRPFPGCQRVISYTNLQETPSDILEIYDEARSKKPDVIKLVTLARTPEEAWPLVQIQAKSSTPTVVVALGKMGTMLSLLGQKLGAPWIYAALERGMEAYPGQATISDLESVYHFPSIQKSTRFVGVTGFGDRETITIAALNAAFAAQEMPVRCLPLGIGNVKVFRKVMDAVKMVGAVIEPEHQKAILEIGVELHGAAKQTQSADVLVQKNDAWHGMNVSCQAPVQALRDVMLKKHPGSDQPFKDRFLMIVGLNAMARMLAAEIQRGGGNAILASHQRKAGMQLAQEIGCRFVAFEALYTTLHDALIICEDMQEDHSRPGVSGAVHAGYLKPGMIVMDLTAGAGRSKLLKEAAARSCVLVEPFDLLLATLEMQAKLFTGKPADRQSLVDAIPERLLEAD